MSDLSSTSKTKTRKICVVGAGKFGVATAVLLARAGNSVTLWGRREEICAVAKEHDENCEGEITGTNDLGNALENAEFVFLAIGAQNLRDVLKTNKQIFQEKTNANCQFISLIKGIEIGTNQFMSGLITDEIGVKSENIVALAGPNLSSDIMKGDKIGITLSFEGEKGRAFDIFKNSAATIDFAERSLIEIISAAKNVYALGCGFLDGKGAGASERATFLTDCVNELEELLKAKTDERRAREAMRSYCGFGDIVLTCTSSDSRNYRFGKLRGSGLSAEAAKAEINSTIEGVKTAKQLLEIALSSNVKTKHLQFICDEVVQQ